jgi:predicted nucleotidyltransferase
MAEMQREELHTILADLRQRLQRIYGDRLVAVLLFGSQARGDAGPESDIDVLVVLEGEVHPYTEIKRTVADVTDVSLARDAAIECSFVSRHEFDHDTSLFMQSVRREGAAV